MLVPVFANAASPLPPGDDKKGAPYGAPFLLVQLVVKET